MERLTIPDVRIDEKTQKRTLISADKVSSYVMEFYWRLKKIEDILGEDYDLDRLRELVEADRNGILITAPFKVDDAVYVITFTCGSRLLGREIIKCKVSTMRIKSDGVTIGYSCRGRYSNGNPYNGNFVYKSIGKTVFRTREAAEAALKGEAYGG